MRLVRLSGAAALLLSSSMVLSSRTSQAQEPGPSLLVPGLSIRTAAEGADNATFHDMTESESLLFGLDFGVVTDVETAPGGTLYVVSLSAGAVYEIHRR